jgi:hypothetical protein
MAGFSQNKRCIKPYPSTYAQKVDIFDDKSRLGGQLCPPPHTFRRNLIFYKWLEEHRFAKSGISIAKTGEMQKFFAAKPRFSRALPSGQKNPSGFFFALIECQSVFERSRVFWHAFVHSSPGIGSRSV